MEVHIARGSRYQLADPVPGRGQAVHEPTERAGEGAGPGVLRVHPCERVPVPHAEVGAVGGEPERRQPKPEGVRAQTMARSEPTPARLGRRTIGARPVQVQHRERQEQYEAGASRGRRASRQRTGDGPAPAASGVEGADRNQEEHALRVWKPEEQSPRKERQKPDRRQRVLAPELELNQAVKQVQRAGEGDEGHSERRDQLGARAAAEAGGDPYEQGIEREERRTRLPDARADRRVVVIDDSQVPDGVPVGERREHGVADAAGGVGQAREVVEACVEAVLRTEDARREDGRDPDERAAEQHDAERVADAREAIAEPRLQAAHRSEPQPAAAVSAARAAGRRSASGRRPGLSQPTSAGLTVTPGGTIPSSRSSTSSESSTSAAVSWDSSCSMVRGPMIAAVTAGWRMTKAMASSMRLMPDSSASCASASAASSLRSFSGGYRSHRLGSITARRDSGTSPFRRYFPDSQPIASGLQVIVPTP